MRVVTYKHGDEIERLGALTEQGVVDLCEAAKSSGLPTNPFADMLGFLSAGESVWRQSQGALGSSRSKALPLNTVRVLPPVPRPGKIVAVGLNYRDHAMEYGSAQPPEIPILFAKFPNSISAHEDPIVIPVGNPNVDWEAELAVVIGRKGKGISAQRAYEYVGGYMPLNDVSARTWQFGDKQWVRGKSPDTFCPTGPYLTTRDEVPDPHTLAIRSRVNGATMQDSSTSKLIFQIPQLIEFISATITLEVGDIIATGTPEGVGVYRKPPVFLKPGDVVEIEIERLGVLRNTVVAEQRR
jgi:2-keto-4-pentenoate hydratase/2-oxohepta-3-ene-1,7-dioic acid hydratase in catechol pathway